LLLELLVAPPAFGDMSAAAQPAPAAIATTSAARPVR
jgi:hypothetical protein